MNSPKARAWKRSSDSDPHPCSASFAHPLSTTRSSVRLSVRAVEADPPSRPLPDITQPVDVWQFVQLRSASVTWLGRKLVSEVALAAAWDEEHTLGARFEGALFIELNGSILPE